ncbi:MAG: zinc ABC transporter substrate-binding protein [Halopseudomonas sp.]
MLALVVALSLSSPAQALDVTTSIKPLQLLVASITDGISQPQLLIPGASSPHDYQLRPSERRLLEQSELIFWIGPELEMSLTKVLQQLPPTTRVVALAVESEFPQQGQHSHTHDHQTSDPHIWLSPEAVVKISQQIAKVLSETDPTHQATYQHNLQIFLKRLKQQNQHLATLLEPVKHQGYFVFHDAYQGFEQHYQLNHLGAFTLSPDRRPGARHLAEIRQQLLNQKAVCVFSEAQFSPALVTNLIEGSQVHHGQLDPLGINIEVDANGYFRLLTQLAEAFQACLSAQ